jgi:hypothetical protein
VGKDGGENLDDLLPAVRVSLYSLHSEIVYILAPKFVLKYSTF